MESNFSHLAFQFLNAVSGHPAAAYGTVFLISFLESLAFFGIIMPGAFLMFGVGVVIATGTLSLNPSVLAAMLGAVCGDGTSYWLGRHFQGQLEEVWPFSRHPKMLDDGRVFFQRHGRKSILLGRFIGPIRPVAPVIAGMLGMAPARFVAVDVMAAIGWAYAYLLPGVVFGTSLAVSKVVSTRLTILAAIVVLIIWSCVWAFRRLAFLLERWDRKRDRLFFSFLVVTAVLAAICFAFTLHSIRTGGILAALNQTSHHLLQSIRTPWGDRLFVAITELGDDLVTAIVAGSVLIVLLAKRCYRSAGFWLGNVLLGSLAIRVLKATFQMPRPYALYPGVSSYGFPSGHALMSVVLFGFAGVLLARGKGQNHARWFLFGATVLISLIMGLSRIVLGAHWLGDVMGGLAAGWLLMSLLGITYLLTSPEVIPRRLLAATIATVWIGIGAIHIATTQSKDLVTYNRHRDQQTMTIRTWRTGGWEALPGWRIDLGGENKQPLIFQWAGRIDPLHRQLLKRGWKPAEGLNLASLFMLLAPTAPIRSLPILPRLHDGHPEQFRLYRDRENTRYVLRIWPSAVRLADHARSVWLGTVEPLTGRRIGPWLTVPAAAPIDRWTLRLVADSVSGWCWWRQVIRPNISFGNPPHQAAWNGAVIVAAASIEEPAKAKPQPPPSDSP